MGQGQTGELISVVICTRNRAGLLNRALKSLSEQTINRTEFEVIVVDDGSRDLTAKTVAAARAAFNALEYRRQRPSGLSAARNNGIEASRGSIVAFLDDDAVAEREWLAQIQAAFATLEPRPACIGGRVVPMFEREPPPWFPHEYLSSLTILDKGPAIRDIQPWETLVGANIAFDRTALRFVGRFDPRLTLYGDEVSVLNRLRRQGERIVYVPGVDVRHDVPAKRLTIRSMMRRKFLGARGEFVTLLESQDGPTWFVLKQLLGRPPQLLVLTLALPTAAVRGDRRTLMRNSVSIARTASMFLEALRALPQLTRSRVATGSEKTVRQQDRR